jgi:arsenite methyltransferase
MERGKRCAICDKTFNLYKHSPYREHFSFVEPLTPVSHEEAKSFDCSGIRERHPKETKGHDYNATTHGLTAALLGAGAMAGTG